MWAQLNLHQLSHKQTINHETWSFVLSFLNQISVLFLKKIKCLKLHIRIIEFPTSFIPSKNTNCYLYFSIYILSRSMELFA